MPKLTRVPEGVRLLQQGLDIVFLKDYGGMPLDWKGAGGVPVVHRHAGSGAQIYWDSGQDPTTAGADGISYFPVHPLNAPTPEYYVNEEAFFPDKDGHEANYTISGLAPYFWLSHEAADDVVPPDPRGPNRWSTRYNDVLNLGLVNYQQSGCPIYFSPKSAVTSGIFLLGNARTQVDFPGRLWSEQLCRTEGGNIAFRFRISLKYASGDAFGGAIFRRVVPSYPAANINDAYSSAGDSLIVNKSGGVDFQSTGAAAVTIIPSGHAAIKASVNSDLGLLLEGRTMPDMSMQIYLDGMYRGTVYSSARGAHFGFYTSCASGYVKFSNREVFDTSARFKTSFSSTSRNTLLWENKLCRGVPPWDAPLYRCIMPCVFTDPAISQSFKIWNHQDREMTVSELQRYPGGMPFVRDVKAAYSGNTSGSAGVFCRIRGFIGHADAHMLVDKSGIFINTMPFSANTHPVPTEYTFSATEWASRIMPELFL